MYLRELPPKKKNTKIQPKINVGQLHRYEAMKGKHERKMMNE
jgi:hypothetical protein